MLEKEAGMFVAALFLARDIAHREHLRTESYSQHMALESFYSGIVDLADDLAETYQGKFNTVLDIPLATNSVEDLPIVDFLEAQLEWIGEERYKAVPREETALQNMIDEIEALYARTLYKLRRLK